MKKGTRRGKEYRKKQLKIRAILTLVVLVILVLVVMILRFKGIGEKADVKTTVISKGLIYENKPEMVVDLLTPNEYSRPQVALEKVNGIVIHYTANPGTTAAQNRGYFEGLKDTKITKASSHFVVGIDGEIVQCIPTKEISYASNERNADTISIECCHPDETGEFTQETYQSLIELTAYLMGKFHLSTDDVIRHYDVTGKNCPKYYVENETAWHKFKDDVNKFIIENVEN